MLKSCWLTLLLLCACAGQAADLRLCQHAPEKYAYRLELTELILARTAATFGPQHIASPEQADPPQERCLHLLQERQDGHLNRVHVAGAAALHRLPRLPADACLSRGR